MCPPVPFPTADIGAFWTDEDLIVCLDKIQHGSALPENVLADVNPFEHEPSNLPDDIWFLVYSENQNETGGGSWKARGKECKIYSDSKLTGWRTTFEYFEGQSQNGLKTDWMMQKYWITQKGSNNLKDNARQAETKSIHPDQFQDDVDCFSTGDYLELLDLVNPRSSSSSSDNSSCVSMASDEVFDYLALLNDLEPENTKEIQSKSTSSKCSVSTSSIPREVLIPPATNSSLVTGEVGESANSLTEGNPSLDLNGKVESKNESNHAGKSHTSKDATHPLPKSHEEASTSQALVPDKGKKIALPKMKMLRKKYFCFMPF